jgi:hypothetical protein
LQDNKFFLPAVDDDISGYFLLIIFIIMPTPLQQDHHKVKASQPTEEKPYHVGRGAQFNTKNKFIKHEITRENPEGIDDWEEANIATQYIEQFSKTIVNAVESKDVGMDTA